MNFRLVMTLISLALVGAAFKTLGVWEHLQDYCSESTIRANPTTIDLGQLSAEESRIVTVRLQNSSYLSAKLIGVESKCSCVATGSLPVDLPGRGSLDRDFQIHAPAQTGSFSVSVVLLMDTDVLQRIPVRFHGDVTASRSSSPSAPVPIPDPAFQCTSL